MTRGTEPRTEAGRKLYDSMRARQSQTAEPITTLPTEGWPFLDAILAIEAEARFQLIEEAIAGVEAKAIAPDDPDRTTRYGHGYNDAIFASVAVLRGLQESR